MARLATRAWSLDGPGARGGDGRPLALLVHGVTSSSRTWWRVGPALAERGFAVLAVDLRGHGSSPPAEQGLGPAHLAADVAETVATELGPAAAGSEPAVDLLVGHSLGAMVCLALLAERPRYARRVLLEDPPGPRGIDWAELATGMEHEGERARREPAALRADWERENPSWPPGEAERRVADMAECDTAAIAAAVRGGLAFDLAAQAAAVDAPVLLILADEAAGSTLLGEDRAELVGAVRNGVTRVLPAGHSVHREALPAYLAAVDEWLAVSPPDGHR
jgi:pimeloyl-ACP methyl ester carboxylesterase